MPKYYTSVEVRLMIEAPSEAIARIELAYALAKCDSHFGDNSPNPGSTAVVKGFDIIAMTEEK